ncbi:MAG: hypothetical protein U0R52_03150 [Solirubrobacterales bacterium]
MPVQLWPQGLLLLALFLGALTAALMIGTGQAGAACGEADVVGSELEGTPCDDLLVAPPGVDTVAAGGGDDVVVGNQDVATIEAGPGDDVIYAQGAVGTTGGEGADTFYGDTSPPAESAAAEAFAPMAKPLERYHLRLGRRNRGLATASSADCPPPSGGFVYCGDGSQDFFGTGGPDIAFGQRGNDNLSGGVGNDRLYGGLGDDSVSGGDDNDLLSGGHGSDYAHGDLGNDLVRGDGTGDTKSGDEGHSGLEGGAGGTDTVSFATAVTPGFTNLDHDMTGIPSFPPDTGERGVYVDLASGVAINGSSRNGGGQDNLAGFEDVVGSPYSDSISGDQFVNYLDGSGGSDVISGAAGNDQIWGGDGGDFIDGGADSDTAWGQSGTDYCTLSETQNGCDTSTADVQLRPANQISAGFVSTHRGPSYTEAYLAGSNGVDSVTMTYTGSTVTFFTIGGTGTFDSANATNCSYPSGMAVCSLPSSIDAVSMAGELGADTIDGRASLPVTTSEAILGGEGGDTLHGADPTEDLVADGPYGDPGADHLWGMGMGDAMLNTGGTDVLYGGPDSDLMISTGLCEGDTIDGNSETDSAQWAQLPLLHRTQTVGVWANLGTDVAGDAGSANIGDCTYSGTSTPDSVPRIEDLEGSGGRDILAGDNSTADTNHLLGRSGPDIFAAGDGNDSIESDSEDDDISIDCGAGTADSRLSHFS